MEIANTFAAKEPRIKVYSNEKNLKLPMSLNKGFSLAHGELFTWTSDDNYYAPNALEVMAQSLLAAPDAMLVYADETLIDDDGKITGEWVMGNVQEGVAKWKGCGGCFLYRAAMQDALKGYDPAMFMIEDYDFFLRGFVRFSYNYLRRADLYFYRFHPASLTGKYMPYVAELQKLSIEKQLDALSQKTSKHDYALLLRKMSVHYIINKGNATKYAVYMHQLRKTSIKQWMLTIVYVPFKGGARWLQQMFQSLKLFFTQLLTS